MPKEYAIDWGDIDFADENLETTKEQEKRERRKKRIEEIEANPGKYYNLIDADQYDRFKNTLADSYFKNMMETVIRGRKGIGYKPSLTYFEGADDYIINHPGTSFIAGDFDRDPRTPKNIVMFDSRGLPIYVDGYYIRDDTKKRSVDAVLGPRKKQRAYKTATKLEKRLYNEYIKQNWMDPNVDTKENFVNWTRDYLYKHPNIGFTTGMHELQKLMADKIKEELDKLELEPRDIRFIELQAHLISNIIAKTKEKYGVEKLKTEEQWNLAKDSVENIRNWPGIIQRYLLKGGSLGVDLNELYDKSAKRDYYYAPGGFNAKPGKQYKYDRTRYLDPTKSLVPSTGSSSSSSAPPLSYNPFAIQNRSPLRRAVIDWRDGPGGFATPIHPPPLEIPKTEIVPTGDE
jgi:hypothetical protein